jgi:LPXTG-site transpeptidase (sortase) family protein
MDKLKYLALALIIGGIIMAAYPVALRIQTNLNQTRLKEEFSYKDDDYGPHAISRRDVISGFDRKAPVWTEWPDTVLKIPKLSVDVVVLEMKDSKIFSEKVNYPPAHYFGTAMPGEIGNLAIAGHRSGPANYFKNLNKLGKGDEILLETHPASYKYVVEDVFITGKYNWDVIKPADYAALTLTTCQSEGFITNAKRLIVRAKLQDVYTN